MRTTSPSTLLVGPRDHTASNTELPNGVVYSCPLAGDTTMQIRATAGTLWVTFEGDPEDYVLEDGETMTFSGPGLLVAEGLQDSNSLEHREITAGAIARWA